MMPARFRMSKRGVGQLLRSPMVLSEMVRRAEVIKGVAEGIAPVESGEYKESFFVQPVPRGGRRRDRAIAIVGNRAPHAGHVEYGTERVTAHHVLLRAAQAGGR